MTNGQLQGLYFFGKGGLGHVSKPQNADSSFRDFVLENADLFGIEEHASSGRGLFGLTKTADSTALQPNGATLQTLTYRQSSGSIPLADGEVIVAIWNDAIASVSGTLYNPTRDLAGLAPKISSDQAAALAQAARETSRTSASVASSALEIWASIPRLVYRVHSSSEGSEPSATEGDILVDAETGEIAHVDLNRADTLSSVSGTFTVYSPDPNLSYPGTAQEVDRTGNGSRVNGTNSYYAYQYGVTDRSSVPGYTGSARANGQCEAFMYSTPAFTYTGSWDAIFRAQHNNCWGQLAVNTANINYYWWPPPDILSIQDRYSSIRLRPDRPRYDLLFRVRLCVGHCAVCLPGYRFSIGFS